MFYIELFKDRKKQWRMRIKSINGKIIMSSEAYSSETKCLNTVASLQDYISIAENLKVKEAKQ